MNRLIPRQTALSLLPGLASLAGREGGDGEEGGDGGEEGKEGRREIEGHQLNLEVLWRTKGRKETKGGRVLHVFVG